MSTPSSAKCGARRIVPGAWLLLGAVNCTGTIGALPQDDPDNGPAVSGQNPGKNGNRGTLGGPTGIGGTGAMTGDLGSATGPAGNPDPGSATPVGTTAPATFSCTSPDAPDPGPSPLRLLSRIQYLNTLQSLFGKLPDLSDALGADTNHTAAFGLLQPDVDQVQLGGFQAATESIAAAVTTNATKLSALAPCASGADQRQCAQSFVQKFGALAYRAPVTDPADIARHMALYDAGAMAGHAHGIELVLRGILQSPRFLYRVEAGTTAKVGTNAVKLSPHELAARLSYVVTDSPPDATLVDAAASGSLATKDQVTAQLSRLLADAKGTAFVNRFLEGWVQLSSVEGVVKDKALYPEWSAAGSTLPASVRGQAQAFFADVLTNQGGTLEALLTSPTVFVNGDLASYYGMTSSGAAFQPVTVPSGRASGILTLPAFLSLMAKPDQSWPIYRGKFVREALFCQDLPAPPPNIPKPPDVAPGVSTRERLAEHETNMTCSGCHSLMDPIGFGFEHYDAIGRYRTTDGNQPVDATGRLTGTDVDGDFDGITELADALKKSKEVRECVARQWFRFTTGRYEQKMDGCSMKSIVTAFESAGSSLNALPKAVVVSDAFFYRRPIDFKASP
jgi:hypothetical protein